MEKRLHPLGAKFFLRCLSIIAGVALFASFSPASFAVVFEDGEKPEGEVVITGVAEKVLDGIFGDTEDHWSKGYVADLVKAEVVQGYEDGTFRPDTPINRAETAAMICRLMEVEETEEEENPFLDVELGAWYGECVSSLKTEGIVEGHPDGTFRPADNINRAELLALAMRLYEMRHGEVDDLADADFYEDIAEEAWYSGIVRAATALEFVQGVECGQGRCFEAGRGITRAEVAAVLHRMFVEEDDDDEEDEEPYTTGEINLIDDNEILVGALEEDEVLIGGMWLVVEEETEILDHEGNALDLEDLEAGMTIEGWITGLVIETDPPSATASKIVVLEEE